MIIENKWVRKLKLKESRSWIKIWVDYNQSWVKIKKVSIEIEHFWVNIFLEWKFKLKGKIETNISDNQNWMKWMRGNQK